MSGWCCWSCCWWTIDQGILHFPCDKLIYLFDLFICFLSRKNFSQKNPLLIVFWTFQIGVVSAKFNQSITIWNHNKTLNCVQLRLDRMSPETKPFSSPVQNSFKLKYFLKFEITWSLSEWFHLKQFDLLFFFSNIE